MPTARIACVALLLPLLTACSDDDASTPAEKPDACPTVTAIIKDLAGFSDNLAASKNLFRRLDTRSSALVKQAPDDIAEDAATLRAAVRTLKPFVDRAKTITALQQVQQKSAKWQAASSDLQLSTERLGEWRTANCK